MYHRVVLIGRLGRDVELKYTADGTPVASFSMAIDDSYGENKKTIWVRVSVWRKQAESCNQYLRKGRQVYVKGRLNHESGNPRVYTRNDGTPGASYEVTAQIVKFLGSSSDAGNGDYDYEEPPVSSAQAQASDDPMPF